MHDSFNNGQFKIKLESTSHPFNKPREKAGKKTNATEEKKPNEVHMPLKSKS